MTQQGGKDWQGELRRTGIVLSREPANVQALLDRGIAAYMLHNWPLAAQSMGRAREIAGDIPAVLRNLTRIHIRMRDHDAALAFTDRLLAQAGGEAEPENLALRGMVLMGAGQPDAAMEAMRRCQRLRPDHPENSYNIGIILLSQGRWEEGLEFYERRWSMLDAPSLAMRRQLTVLPAWNPATDGDVDLVIGVEQGLGDMIMVARYLPAIAAQVRSVTIMAPPSLIPLLSHNFAPVRNLRCMPPGPVAATANGRHLMSMSILHAMEARPDTLPAPHGYLSAAPWADHRRRTRSRPAVGIVWRGSATHQDDDIRSIPPALVGPLLERSPHIDFHALSPPSFQPLAGAAPANLHFSVTDGEGLEVTAAVMEEMDLVISVDSAPCHLAGALGLPVWTLMRHHAEWRWGTGGQTQTPWYSSMTLLRQPSPGDWAGLLEQVTERLAGMEVR